MALISRFGHFCGCCFPAGLKRTVEAGFGIEDFITSKHAERVRASAVIIPFPSGVTFSGTARANHQVTNLA